MAQDRLFWLGVAESLFAKWHGDKATNKAATNNLNQIRRGLEEVAMPTPPAPPKTKRRTRRK